MASFHQCCNGIGTRGLFQYNRHIAGRTPHIGTLNEGSLHAALKAHYARPGDAIEVPLDGFVIDIRRSNLLVEIQTGSFGAMGRKFDLLLDRHRMLLVYPIAAEVYLHRPRQEPRKARYRGSVFDLFAELVSIPTLLDHPHLSLEVALVSVTRVQRVGRRGRYRTVDQKLLSVLETRRFSSTADLVALLPDLPGEFTTADLAKAAGVSRATAQKMAFCFRALEVIAEVRRSGAGIHYVRK